MKNAANKYQDEIDKQILRKHKAEADRAAQEVKTEEAKKNKLDSEAKKAETEAGKNKIHPYLEIGLALIVGACSITCAWVKVQDWKE